MGHVESKRVHCSTLVKSFSAVQSSEETGHTCTSCAYKIRNNDTVKLSSKLQLALNSLCTLHEGIQAELFDQDDSAEQILDMAVSNPLANATCCSFLSGLLKVDGYVDMNDRTVKI